MTEDTRPRRPEKKTTQPRPPANDVPITADVDPEGSTGPGCFVWGVMAGFMLVLGCAVVAMAAFAGWSDGLRTARSTATAAGQAYVADQCARIEDDIAAGSTGLVQARLQDLLAITPAVSCVAVYGPTATALYLESLPTETATPTPSPTAEAATQVTAEADGAPVERPTIEAASGGEYDPEALLSEARQLLNEGEVLEAVELLEAIQAIDPDYERATVNQLIYNGLVTEAQRLYRTGTNLAEAVLLTDRAEEYGDVGELNYERFIASLYLEAQFHRDVNYPRAIQLLRRIVYEQGLRNYLDAASLLFEQYVAYGDALAIGGDPCTAVQQYQEALNLQNSPNVSAKRDNAQTACDTGLSGSQTPGTPGPAADPNDPNATPAPTIAPIGVPGT